ncbi:hypothetical protein KO02_16585 [Sphingobacterium sp. ML3W]|uniref:hypothetical protein n=1 Tax=Sphingobacterium sp. ML3W TaxID=1538644 RepID=UPI0004F693DC|nr:hypothetical protein [Sphingobacterium sp. ML3W]AIM38115.1 hypothetical protein KO02_16585 [Sphingobacterium sp. ML3W]
MPWFKLDSYGTPTDAQDYSLVGTIPPSGCDGTDQICAVQATADSNNFPQLTTALKDQMINALHTRTASTNVQLKDA